ncbi:DUF4190 domain-containing protein [Streptomyces sp. NPDC007905]|uniref:DUF4190 domain-containing protein n=1 Tax=Streptomyces sp. NPDC007905 TaxID=3364788 RepID=UPI0036E09C2E
MSDEVPQSMPPEHGAGGRPTSPRVSLDKESGERSVPEQPVPDPPGAAPPASTDPWAAPTSRPGAGDTVLSGASGAPAPAPHPSVHDQQTVTSLSMPDAPADAVPPAWAKPADPYASPAVAPSANAPANPFAPPSADAPATPFTPPGAAYSAGAPVHPYAPSAPAAPGNPYAPPTASAAQPQEAVPVPPPPIAPDGPGQVPYGYPAAPSAYGYPAQQPQYAGPGIPSYPAANGYAWPGLQQQPNNGMGTASLVLGILASVGFCAWPLALVMGVLAVILGALGRGKARRGEATNPGVALAGIICGAAGIVLVLGLFAFAIAYYS